MHDPMTLAFSIKNPFSREKYKPDIISIWHVDPCKGPGGDDSCGWFKRAHHGDKGHFERIKKDFDFDWDRASKYDDGGPMFMGYFHPAGDPLYSSYAIALGLYWRALLVHFDGSWNKSERFIRRHLYSILQFTENPYDSMITTITNKYNSKRDDRIQSMASMIYGDILRKDQKWWQHPRWHFWHWEIQVHPIANFKRWAFSRCCRCGGRFRFGESPTTDCWEGTGPLWFRSEKHIYHSGDCGNNRSVNPEAMTNAAGGS